MTSGFYNLCTPGQDCLSEEITCPANCSDHGTCSPFTPNCNCYNGYSGNIII